jgi:hypothetical protein
MSAKQLWTATGKVEPVQVGEACDVVAGFVGADGLGIAKASLVSLVATLYDAETLSVINSRNAQNVLDANDGTVVDVVDGDETTATLTLRLGASDSIIVGTVDVGDTERHILRLAWTWNDGVATRPGIDEWELLVERIAVTI